MLEFIDYRLPEVGPEGHAFFSKMAELFADDPTLYSPSPLNDQLLFRPGIKNGVDLKPRTRFCLDPMINKARIDLVSDKKIFTLPPTFLADPNQARAGMSFDEAATLLMGWVTKVDHTGVGVPFSIPAADWSQAMDFIALETAVFHDYPDGIDLYNREKSRWLFAIPATTFEKTNGISQMMCRDPKVEFVCDDVPCPFLQIDMQTNLTRAQTTDRFPQGFEIEGLENYFRSVWVTTPFPGVRLRLDLRYAEIDTLGWENSRFLLSGTPIKAGHPATKIPRLSLV
jgi:hypothetical protein